MSAPQVCPHCDASMQGDPVPEKYRVHAGDCPKIDGAQRCYCFPYGEETTHFLRVMGHEVRGVYDGVLFWSCPDCQMAWPRWNDGAGRLSVESVRACAEYNAAVMTP